MPIFQWGRGGNPTSSPWGARDADVTLDRPTTHSMLPVPGSAADGKQTGVCGPPQASTFPGVPIPRLTTVIVAQRIPPSARFLKICFRVPKRALIFIS